MQDLTQGQWPEGRLKCGLGEGKVGHEQMLEPCWTMMQLEGGPPEDGGLTASSLPLLDCPRTSELCDKKRGDNNNEMIMR